MASEPGALPPSVDLPALAVRWEGLVVTVDATTLNTLVRRVFRRVEEVEEILIEPDNGRLGLAVKVRKSGIGITFRSHLSSLRVKDGLLGLHVDDARVFGFVSIPRWVFQRIADRGLPGRAVFFPEDRDFVIN